MFPHGAWKRLRKCHDEMGWIMSKLIPFVRTVSQAERVIDLLAANGLKRGENGLRVIMMCEVPSNAIWLSSSWSTLTASLSALTI